ncbi:UNVERIFIED_CONTAM: hypothetical protein Sradi_6246000 [Sesamum radiatum]|uniref:DUF4283 domain-containing protein n=1 Tax=Sesamum radiatum TaxID=300843 RepID=A0AAW2KAA2_SESRA
MAVGLCEDGEIFLSFVVPDMEAKIDRLRSKLKLTEEEGQALVHPGGYETQTRNCTTCAWLAELTPIVFLKFEAFRTLLGGMLNPIKGMAIKQLDAGRFLLRFNHTLDWGRELEGCPWSFENNHIILNRVSTLIGNRIGKFRDIEMDEAGCSWGATLRICIGVVVNTPFK